MGSPFSQITGDFEWDKGPQAWAGQAGKLYRDFTPELGQVTVLIFADDGYEPA
jgi:hypothetical protein